MPSTATTNLDRLPGLLARMNRVLIVGAGISGLAAAYRLQQLVPRVDLTVLEQSSRVGGNAWTERADRYQAEIGPNGFLDSKPNTSQLCRDLGLGEKLISASEVAGKNRYPISRWQAEAVAGQPRGVSEERSAQLARQARVPRGTISASGMR